HGVAGATDLDPDARPVDGVGPEVVDLLHQRGVAAEDAAQRDGHADLEFLPLALGAARSDEGAARRRERQHADENRREPPRTARSACHRLLPLSRTFTLGGIGGAATLPPSQST